MDNDTTNPIAGDDRADAAADATAAADAGVADSALDTAADNEQPHDEDRADPNEDSEEIEHEGRKYLVPRALKPLMLMQADYTRKTQEVAEQRRAVQAERQALHQSSQAELDTYARATTLAGQIAQYQQVDWRAWHESDPFAAAAATSEYNMLRDQHSQALGQLSQLAGQRTFLAQQDAARRMEAGRAALAQEIPGWSDDLKARLIGFAAGYGFSRDELDDLEADPRVAKVLHAAFSGSRSVETARKVQNTLAAQQVQPAASVKARGAPPSGLDDRLSPDEWMRRRNAQTRRRA
jgi:hypothetical protein